MDTFRCLLSYGFISRMPTADEKRAIKQASGVELYCQILSAVPDLLTPDGKALAEAANADIAEYHADERRRWQESQRLGEFAPELRFVSKVLTPREEGDVDATEKQLDYLRLLGVKDETALTGIGKRQAGRLIDKVIELRGDS